MTAPLKKALAEVKAGAKIPLRFKAELSYDPQLGSFIIDNRQEITVGEVTEQEALSALESDSSSKSAAALAAYAKRLRQAKKEYFADDPETLSAITPFDSIAYDMEREADLLKQEMEKCR